MKKYWLEIARAVRTQIDNLPGNVRQRVRREIDALADEPRPSHAKLLENDLAGHLRISVDRYRIVYTVEDDIVVVIVVHVGKRGPNTYENLLSPG